MRTILTIFVLAVLLSGCINCRIDWHHEGDNNATVPVSALP